MPHPGINLYSKTNDLLSATACRASTPGGTDLRFARAALLGVSALIAIGCQPGLDTSFGGGGTTLDVRVCDGAAVGTLTTGCPGDSLGWFQQPDPLSGMDLENAPLVWESGFTYEAQPFHVLAHANLDRDDSSFDRFHFLFEVWNPFWEPAGAHACKEECEEFRTGAELEECYGSCPQPVRRLIYSSLSPLMVPAGDALSRKWDIPVPRPGTFDFKVSLVESCTEPTDEWLSADDCVVLETVNNAGLAPEGALQTTTVLDACAPSRPQDEGDRCDELGAEADDYVDGKPRGYEFANFSLCTERPTAHRDCSPRDLEENPIVAGETVWAYISVERLTVQAPSPDAAVIAPRVSLTQGASTAELLDPAQLAVEPLVLGPDQATSPVSEVVPYGSAVSGWDWAWAALWLNVREPGTYNLVPKVYNPHNLPGTNLNTHVEVQHGLYDLSVVEP